ncbi:hypothetical protein JMF89_15800 [Clostridiaceae bacterium UIB06]|nr:hypothetical protein [Clostridiaceae bacterium UIB06]
MSTDLNIRVISNLQSTEFFVLYQQDINLNSKNFKVGAWEKGYIAPGAQFYTVLPVLIEVQGRSSSGPGVYETKILDVDYNKSYELFSNSQGLDIRASSLTAPTDNTTNIYNATDSIKEAVILKDSKPLFSATIRPDNKLNFSIHPSLYIAIVDYELTGEFFDAAAFSPLTKINYEGQGYLTITLSENAGTGQFSVDYNFDSFNLY